MSLRSLLGRTRLLAGARALLAALAARDDGPLRLDPDDPLLRAATLRARATLARFRRLRAEDVGRAAVKFAFTTDGGAREHVWAEVLAAHLEEVVARIASRPVTQRGPLPARVSVPLDAIEDWAVTLPDGAVHGSFTTLAMIAACRRDGREVPRALRGIRFLDAEEPALHLSSAAS